MSMSREKFWLPTAICLAIAIIALLAAVKMTPALAGTIDELKNEGQELAITIFYPILVLMNPNRPGVSLGTESIIQYVAAFAIIFAVIYNVLGKNKLGAVVATLVIMTWINYFVTGFDWHKFFMQVMPALFVYLVTIDILRMTLFRTVTIQTVGLFGFGVTYWFLPTTQFFDSLFGAFYMKSMGYLVFLTFVIVLTRMAKVVSDSVWYGTGREASIAINRKMHEAGRAQPGTYTDFEGGREGWGGPGGGQGGGK